MTERCARGLLAATLAAALLASAGCGGTRQDESEPSGEFKVGVTDASFPAKQSIAQRARMKIEVRNTDKRALPNVAVTVQTKPDHTGAAPLAFGSADSDTRLADTDKPVWIVDAGPHGGTTAYTNTWALGPMFAGETKEFVWRVTPVQAGTHRLRYRIAAGLNGRAKAVLSGNRAPERELTVRVSSRPAPARVNPETGAVEHGG
jgi:hypothetical protein